MDDRTADEYYDLVREGKIEVNPLMHGGHFEPRSLFEAINKAMKEDGEL